MDGSRYALGNETRRDEPAHERRKENGGIKSRFKIAYFRRTHKFSTRRKEKKRRQKKSKRQNKTKQIKEPWAWARLQARVRLRAWIWACQWHGFWGSGTRSIDLRLKFFRLKRQGRFGTAASELPVTIRTHGGTEGQARGKNQNDDDVYDTWSGVGYVA